MTVERLRDTTRTHPLATLQGLRLLTQCLAAGDLWRGCTPTQRQVLRSRYQTVRAEVERAGELREPVRPVAVDAKPATLAALERRGLVADGVLTGDGLAVVWWRGGATT